MINTGKVIGYKIRRKSDGLYSTGGMVPGWNRNGKVWLTRAALHNHFAVLREAAEYRARNIYRFEGGHLIEKEIDLAVKLAQDEAVSKTYGDCELVSVTEAESVSMHEYLASIYKPRRRA